MPLSSTKQKLLIVLSFFAIYVIWGSTFLAIRLAVEQIPPFVVGAMRFLAAGTVLFVTLGWRHRKSFTSHHASTAAFSGIVMAGLGNGLVIWAEQSIPSGTASLWIATVPIWILFLNWVGFEKRRPAAQALVGALIGVLGISLLSTPASDTGSFYGTIGLLAAALFWSLGTLYQRTHPGPMHPFLTSSIQMFAGGVFLLLLAGVLGEGKSFAVLWADPARYAMSLGAVLYLSLAGSVVAFTAYSWLVKTVDPQKVATYALVNPVIALLLGGLFAGEVMTARLVIVAVLVLSGVALILMRKRTMPVLIPVARIPKLLRPFRFRKNREPVSGIKP